MIEPMHLPQGYTYSVKPTGTATDYTVTLFYERKIIGTVRVSEATAKCAGRSVRVHETHCSPGLDPTHRNKGLGIFMYAVAIEHGLRQGFTVVSSWNPSALAQRVWRSQRLSERFMVNKFAKRWWTSPPRVIEEEVIK